VFGELRSCGDALGHRGKGRGHVHPFSSKSAQVSSARDLTRGRRGSSGAHPFVAARRRDPRPAGLRGRLAGRGFGAIVGRRLDRDHAPARPRSGGQGCLRPVAGGTGRSSCGRGPNRRRRAGGSRIRVRDGDRSARRRTLWNRRPPRYAREMVVRVGRRLRIGARGSLDARRDRPRRRRRVGPRSTACQPAPPRPRGHPIPVLRPLRLCARLVRPRIAGRRRIRNRWVPGWVARAALGARGPHELRRDRAFTFFSRSSSSRPIIRRCA
jgi:hypothetical protein